MRHLLTLCALWALSAVAAHATPERCQMDVACPIGARSYHVREPDDWDGNSPLPVLIHFHGWQRTGALPVQHQRISGATRRRGVLLVAPNGLRKTWNMWTPETEDVQFAADVLGGRQGALSSGRREHLCVGLLLRVDHGMARGL